MVSLGLNYIIEISTGVPQGSILGPLLFSIYINIILSSNKLQFFRNSDDTTIYFNLKDFDKIVLKQR